MVTRYSHFKSVALVASFMFLMPVALATSIYALLNVHQNIIAKADTAQVLAMETSVSDLPVGVNIYASLPKDVPSIDSEISSNDARAELVRQYLFRYSSPLEKYADYIVKMADHYKIDFRLITAIAQQESNLCRFIPEGTYNCWGWGIHSRGTLGFLSYEEGIQVVTEGLKDEYIDKGLETPYEIMGKYTPLSNGSWAQGVEMFMEEMR